MIFNIYLLCIIILFVEPISASRYRRFRRQIGLPRNDDLSNDARLVRFKAPSGSIPGTAYYGIGSDPNYGSFVSRPNTASGGGVMPISYNPNSNLYGYLIQPSHKHQQSQQQQGYLYNNNYNRNNAWQRPNTNNYYSQYYNRYEPGNQGWYATGSDYWLNNGQSVIAHPCLLFITIAILFFCK